MSFVVGIDVGTTGAKCGLFQLNGEMIASAYREYVCEYPKPNWVEQDVVMVVNNAFETVKEVIEKAKINVKEIVSVSVSSQRTCSIFIDANDKPLKMISWQDNRTRAEVEEICEKISQEEYYTITGLPMNTTWVLTKMMWMRKNCKEIWDKTKRVVQLQDYILHRLGADDYYIDIPDAVLMGVWDNDKGCYSKKILELFYIDEKMLPIPRKCGTKVAAISDKAQEKTGLLAGTPVCVGAGDQNAAAVGAGVIQEGIASVSIGTGGMAIIMLNHSYRDKKGKTCIGRHAIDGKWQIEGYQIGAAGVFRWCRDEIAKYEKEQSKTKQYNVYEKMNELTKQVPAGANGLVFLPYLASAAAPKWNPDARGTLVGLTFAHDRRHMMRAVMEGITLEQKDILRSMRETGNKISKVRIMGGASKSELWCQMQADMYETQVETLKITDTALVGAAIFAGLGVGAFKTIEEAVQAMVHVDKTYLPDEKNVAIYNQLYEIFEKTYQAMNQNNVYELVAKLQNM